MSTQDDRLVAAHRRVAIRGTQGRQCMVWGGMEVGNDGGDYRLTGTAHRRAAQEMQTDVPYIIVRNVRRARGKAGYLKVDVEAAQPGRKG